MYSLKNKSASFFDISNHKPVEIWAQSVIKVAWEQHLGIYNIWASTLYLGYYIQEIAKNWIESILTLISQAPQSSTQPRYLGFEEGARHDVDRMNTCGARRLCCTWCTLHILSMQSLGEKPLSQACTDMLSLFLPTFVAGSRNFTNRGRLISRYCIVRKRSLAVNVACIFCRTQNNKD